MNNKVNYRTCVCCKASKPKFEMVRIATFNGNVICDTDYKSAGRGFYICSEDCLGKILTSKKFLRYSNMIADENVLNEVERVLKNANKS